VCAGGLPIGAVLVKQRVADAMAPGDHGSTFAGNPLVTAAAKAVVDIIAEPAFLEGVLARGEKLRGDLRRALAGNAHVKEVRGLGLITGIQLDVVRAPTSLNHSPRIPSKSQPSRSPSRNTQTPSFSVRPLRCHMVMSQRFRQKTTKVSKGGCLAVRCSILKMPFVLKRIAIEAWCVHGADGRRCGEAGEGPGADSDHSREGGCGQARAASHHYR